MPADDRQKTLERDLTRRQWLLQLGQSVALTGFSGTVTDLAAQTASQANPADSSPAALPPGLYLPSPDHLSHALVSDDRFHAIVPGSETEYAQPRTGPYQPLFFSAEVYPVARRLVKLLLGEAPPAVVEEVTEWLDLAVFSSARVRQTARQLAPEYRLVALHFHGEDEVGRIEADDPQRAWREGLAWLARESPSRFHKAFLDLSAPEQLQLVSLVCDERANRDANNAGVRLFQALKAEALRGFYTSRAGLDELDYQGNTFHAECPGCSARGPS